MGQRPTFDPDPPVLHPGDPAIVPGKSVPPLPGNQDSSARRCGPTTAAFRANMRLSLLPATPSRARGPRRPRTGDQIGAAILDRERSRGPFRGLFRIATHLGEGQQASRQTRRPRRSDRPHRRWRARHATNEARGNLAGLLKATYQGAHPTRLRIRRLGRRALSDPSLS